MWPLGDFLLAEATLSHQALHGGHADFRKCRLALLLPPALLLLLRLLWVRQGAPLVERLLFLRQIDTLGVLLLLALPWFRQLSPLVEGLLRFRKGAALALLALLVEGLPFQKLMLADNRPQNRLNL